MSDRGRFDVFHGDGDDAFTTSIALSGPFRAPAQMLAEQEYDGHASVHDDATADKLGLRGAPIEGPTHFSQFDPLGVRMWGRDWFESGCISAHFENMVIEGELVQAFAVPESGHPMARIHAMKNDGTRVLSGTMSVFGTTARTELDERFIAMKAKGAGELFIVDQLTVGETGGPKRVTMGADEHNGHLYPFSLNDKLKVITEPSPWYSTGDNPWGRPIIPTEMASVLAHKAGGVGTVRGPAVGLFLDLEVRLLEGPLFVDEEYELVHTITGLGQSRRVESWWTETMITSVTTGRPVCSVLLHQGVFKESYAGYPTDRL